MRNPFLAGAVVVVTTAALAACGSSGGGGGDEAAGPGPAAASGPAAPSEPVTGSGAGSQDSAPAGPRASRSSEPPKIPSDRLTPATGTFTKKQKEYLTGRVPVGMDPAAVLQSGQESCDRLTYLVKVDRDLAAGAVVAGEVSDAESAAAHLCTRHRELVERASHGYADGVHRGEELRPGRYRDVSPTARCTWEVTGPGGNVLVSGSSADGKRTTITVPKAALAFTSTGCYAWLPEGDNG
ncbi:hypothetical protein E6R18_19270 [Streptomyces sp. A1277]|uniref:hypothetical protein n=1 Tax=Streptomyces sp. A1277 TaxID=2563103 RepID=UPI0010A28EFF|nr:hypothetical protein [Streptomyces sp. A1277]THA30713.1 hypothetical protein E6R18_19270 [Streptomyces sp. A1277]